MALQKVTAGHGSGYNFWLHGYRREKAPDGKVQGQQPTLLGAEKVMYQVTRHDGRRTQHVGILGNQWTAHDRGVGDKGVPATAH